MNIKHIIRKVLNESIDSNKKILELLDKRGIDPFKDIDNTINLLANTIGLDYKEIDDFYYSILGIQPFKDPLKFTLYLEKTLGFDLKKVKEIYNNIFMDFKGNIDDNTFYEFFDEIFNPDDIHISQEGNSIYLDKSDGKELMYIKLPDYYIENPKDIRIKYKHSSPVLFFSLMKNEFLLDMVLGDTWKEPFKKWINERFGLTIKTVGS